MIKTRGNSFQPDFTIGLHKKDSVLLHEVKDYFGVGTIRESGDYLFYSVKRVDFQMGHLELIVNVIIPHFDLYPLQTKKLRDYLLFKDRVLMMKDKKHLTLEGKATMVNIKANIN